MPSGLVKLCRSLLVSLHRSARPAFLATVLCFSMGVGLMIGWLTYSIRADQFLYDMTREAETLLTLTSSYVSTYTDIVKEHNDQSTPVPAEFRAKATLRFNARYDNDQSLMLSMVGITDRYIKTPPTDELLSRQLALISQNQQYEPASKVEIINGARVLRSVFPSIANNDGCVSCHNQLQPDGPIWQSGDLMGAHVIDRGIEQPLSRITKQACVAALMAALLTLLALIIVRQNLKLKSSAANLQRLANTDSLTGCLNRRALLSTSTETMQQQGADGGLIALDLDHFKQINDTYGHQIGDNILIHFSDIVRHQIRDTDIFARVGGEEFVVYLPGATKIESAKIAQRICRAVAESAYKEKDHVIHFTVSVGVVQMIESRYCTFMTWLNAADRLLYEAKESGRNRVSLRA